MTISENIDQNYANVYNNKVGYGKKPALLLIDFVEAYYDKSCELYADVEDALASAQRVLEAARKAGILVVYTNVVYHKSGVNGGAFFKKAKPLRYFTEGSPMGAWAGSLNPTEDELVISKQYPSAFFGTSLSSTLAAHGADSVILTGLTTSGCVRASCVDACSHGFIPIVVEEACGDRHEAPHKANLFDMNAKYGDVVSENEIITYLQSLNA
ncbi:isochorismatase family protein [Aliiglaciecola sp. SL4]|uniref:isochorismatase family protein n=1 Tax=Aliiglaciecola sp. SL4 TaxID=3239806 RepID=UPI00355BB85D